MGCVSATLGVVLWGFIHLSTANKDACDFYSAVGQNFTLPFDYEPLTATHGLKWTHDNKTIFVRERSNVSLGKADFVSLKGSLLLKNLQFSDAGIYQADVLNPNGKSAKTWQGRLCVVDKVWKPQLTYVCDFKSNAVNLNCIVNKPQGLLFSWALEGNNLPGETKQTLSMSLAKLQGETKITCSVANKGSMEKSDAVHPVCKSTSPTTTGCFTSKPVMAVLAGGAGLILLLVIIILLLCCRHKRNRDTRNNVELRMSSQKKRDSLSTGPDYETMNTTEHYVRQSPKPSPRACYQTVSHTENKASLPTAAEGQTALPVPKPRTKSPLSASQELVA